jgi:hypothetical protein
MFKRLVEEKKTMAEREKEAYDWTLESVKSWRGCILIMKEMMEGTLDDPKGWDCSAMWALKDLYNQMESFLEDTDPENDERYGVEW